MHETSLKFYARMSIRPSLLPFSWRVLNQYEADDEFVEASGLTRKEQVGQSHNIVRHPDMPLEAFRDLWATLQRAVAQTATSAQRLELLASELNELASRFRMT